MSAIKNKYANLQKSLVIVESPAKCKKIEEYLGLGYKCVASYGHLRELNSLKNIHINDNDNTFTPEFTIINTALKKKHIEFLRKEILNSREIILATDDDREGEAIAWHICILFNLNPTTTKRIIFHEITKTAIEQSIRNPQTINMNIVYAQQARQIIDLFVGFHISPQLWKYIAYNAKNALSAGRCQTPALRLLYDNEKDIRANPGKKIYKITGYFTNLCIPFELNHDIPISEDSQEDEQIIKFLEYSADNAKNHIYTHTTPERTYKLSPDPFTTSRLQQISSNELHISPKETMKICQTLYEAGYITYMRTDSNKYSGEFLETIKEYILKTYDEKYMHNNINIHLLGEKSQSKEVVQNSKHGNISIKSKSKKQKEDNKNDTIGGAHEAIRPTNIKMQNIDSDKFTSREKRVYKLIWRNTLQSCMANAEYNSFNANIHISDSVVSSNTKNAFYYKYHTEQLIFAGWKIADPSFSPLPSSQSEKNYVYLLNLSENSRILYKKITATLTIKNQKQHYTEARLIQLLEEKGIGRPSTFSMLIDKIQEKEYALKQDVKGQTISCKDYEIEYDEMKKEASDIFEIETSREIGNEKNKLVIQPLGMIVLDFLEKHFLSLFDYNFTEKMENDLDEVAKGQKDYNLVCGECLNEINKLVNLSVVNDNSCEGEDDGKSSKNEKPIKLTKVEYKIDDNHYYIIGKNGPVIKCVMNVSTNTEDQDISTFLSATSSTKSNEDVKKNRSKNKKPKEQVSFLSIRKDIVFDIERLKRGEYKLSDLVDGDIMTNNNNNGTKTIEYKNERNLGKSDKMPNNDIILKLGRYGMYALCGDMKKSLSCFGNRPLSNITLEEVSEVLFGSTDNQGAKSTQNKIIRKITDNLSIRDGKYGHYIFYKTQYMKNPRFISLNGYKGNICEETDDNVKKWIRENCHIDI